MTVTIFTAKRPGSVTTGSYLSANRNKIASIVISPYVCAHMIYPGVEKTFIQITHFLVNIFFRVDKPVIRYVLSNLS